MILGGLLFALIVLVLVPVIAQYHLPLLIHEVTGLNCRIASVALDPFEFRLSIKGLELDQKDGARFASFDELSADFDLTRSLRQTKVYITELRLDRPYVRISRQKDGHFNYEDLNLASFEDDRNTTSLPFEIASLRLIQGVLDWHDELYKHPVGETLQPIDLELTGISSNQEKPSPFSLGFTLKSGTALNWNGSFSLDPWQAEGAIKISDLQNRQLSDFILQNQAVSLTNGINQLESRCRVEYQKDQWHIRLEQLKLAANDFLLSEAEKTKPMIDIRSLHLHDAELDLNWHSEDGTLQFDVPKGEMLVDKFALADPGAQTLSLDVAKGTVKNINVSVAYSDVLKLTADTEHISIENAELSIDRGKTVNVSVANTAIGPLQYSLNQSASNSAYDMQASQQSLHLKRVSASWQANQVLQVNAGDLVLGKVDFLLQTQKDDSPQIVIQQDSFQAKQVSLREQAEKDVLAKATAVSTGNMRFDLKKKQLLITSAAASGSDVKLWLDKNGQLNYQTLFASGGPEKLVTEAETSVSSPKKTFGSKSLKAAKTRAVKSEWLVAVNKLAVDNGSVDFTDRSQNPPMSLMVTDINAGVKNFSTGSQSPLPINLSATLNHRGKVDLSGRATLFPVTAAMDVKLQQLPVRPFQAYFERLVNLDIMNGFLNADGKLAFDLRDPVKPLLSFQGASGINQFQTRVEQQRSDLAKWDDLTITGVDFNLDPLRFNAAEAQIERPYLRVTIDKERQLNLAKLFVNPTPQATTNPSLLPTTDQDLKHSEVSYDIKKIRIYSVHLKNNA